jgi:gas vesicle protein
MIMANDNGSSAFSWFLAGLGLGSLLGVLYAPRAGYETREELVASALGSGEYLRQRSREAQRTAGEYVDRGRGQVNDYVERGKEQVNYYVGRGKAAAETGRTKINETYTQGKQVIADQKEKLNAAYEAGKQAYVETTAAPVPSEELIPSPEKAG